MPPNLSCTTPLESRDQQQTIHSGIKVPSENGKKLAKPNPVHAKRNGMAFNSPRTRNRLHARVCHPLFILGISRVKRHFIHDCSIGYRWNDGLDPRKKKQKQGLLIAPAFYHHSDGVLVNRARVARLVVYTCSPRLLSPIKPALDNITNSRVDQTASLTKTPANE